jgi:exodeoxyribonuclease VIII
MKTAKDSNEKYHSSPGISASGLKTIYKKSVYHYLNRKPFESKSMAFGTAVHTALLEPDNFNKEYYVLHNIDRRTKAGKEQFAAAEKLARNKVMLPGQDKERIDAINKNFKKSTLAQYYSKGQIELSHYGEYQGANVRIRPDVLNRHKDFIADVKTCQDNSPKAFKNDVYKYSYHLQAAFYMDMLEINFKRRNDRTRAFSLEASICRLSNVFRNWCYTKL